MKAVTTRLSVILALCATVLGGACNGQVSSGKGSETSWLTGCVTDENCQVGHCVCGVCTASCTQDADCPGEAETCAATGSTAFSTLCGAPVVQRDGVCVHGCGGGAACATGFVCTDGTCLPETGTVTSGFSVSGPWSAGLFVDSITVKGGAPLSAKCLPRSLEVSVDGSVPCQIMRVSPDSSCDCSASGLKPNDPRLIAIARKYARDSGACDTPTTPACDSECVCEVQAFGYDRAERTECLQDRTKAIAAMGYCYVDPAQGIGSTEVVGPCPPNQQQMLRIGGQPDGAMYVLACLEPVSVVGLDGPGLGGLGAACIPSDELDPNFGGYQPIEVAVDFGSPDCATGVCLVNAFRGRVTCAYGQADPAPGVQEPGRECYTPDAAHTPVRVAVDPWIVSSPVAPAGRRPGNAVYCSCRCDGPEPFGNFCQCPSGFECTPLVDDIGKGRAASSGSYCVKTGTVVTDIQGLQNGPGCVRPVCGP